MNNVNDIEESDDFIADQRAWLVEHKATSGQSWAQLHQPIGRPGPTLSLFSSGKYNNGPFAGGNGEIAKLVYRYRQTLNRQQELRVEAPDIPSYFETPTSRKIMNLLAWAQRGRINANSTIITSATADLPVYAVSNAKYMTPIGGPLTSITATRWRPGSWTDIPANNRRLSGHGSGIRFATYATTIGIVADFRGSGAIAYVTDPTTGLRARTQANDYAPTSGLAENVLTFASRALRIVEVYGADTATYYTGVNVPATDSVWAVSEPDQARIGIEWDSWGGGTGSGNTNATKLTITDFLGERFGTANVFNPSLGSTGVIAPNNTSASLNLVQRLQAGDFDAARVGTFDAIFMPGSLNDYILSGTTTAQFQAATTMAVQLMMAAQPDAIIFGTGQQYTTSSGTSPQAWHDAAKAGFLAAAGSDPRMIWLDSSPAGENWMFGTTSTGINSVIFTGAQNHVNDAGMAYVGYRMADSAIAALKARVGF